ncbi:Uncharacterised protein [Mycobacteroides abscessus subsp. abscessus]|uniref:hypothetical protein n=1 Tax=Mycobacteroides abscessus TaxID=36809 RepID=UPI0009A63563|nr:hypothetical protein [Mycobacteroides abscessus]SKM36219.1 Uncharacterised protein [Mycobacteroides abscessus subsp. abscessus]
MTTALTPEVTALWREAGAHIAAAGLAPDQPNREAMIVVAGAYAAAQASAYAEEADLHGFLGWELLAAGALDAWGRLSRAELLTVEVTVARTWRVIAAEVGRLRTGRETAA